LATPSAALTQAAVFRFKGNKMQKCETCDYWMRGEKSDMPVGQCRVYPPRIYLVPMMPSPRAPNGGVELQALLPNTFAQSGCSLHKTKLSSVSVAEANEP
jgi:hypothetical protein